MKVLHVLKSDQYAGAENAAITICSNLKDAYETAYASKDGKIGWHVRKAGIPFYPMQRFSFGEIQKVLEEFRPDVIHAHDFSASVFCAVLKRDCYLISHLHNNPLWIRAWNIRALAYFLAIRRIDRILVASGEIQQEAVFLDKRKEIFIVGNPVHTAVIKKRAEEYPQGDFALLFVGRFTEQKNPQRFIRIVNELAVRMKIQQKNIFAVMLGSGELERTCRQMVQKLGLAEYMELPGFSKNPYPYIKKARLLLVTSDWEGYGIAAAEAVSLGTPVLAMAVGGLKTVFRQFPEALCRSEAEMSRKAQRLLEDKTYYRYFQRKMKEKVCIMEAAVYAAGIENIYNGLAVRERNFERCLDSRENRSNGDGIDGA